MLNIIIVIFDWVENIVEEEKMLVTSVFKGLFTQGH